LAYVKIPWDPPGPAARIHWTPPTGDNVLVPPVPIRLSRQEVADLYKRVDQDNRLVDTGSLLLASLAFGLIMARLVNINKFSPHPVSRNRLIRTFLGASRDVRERRPDPFTGFDPDDNLEIHRLRTPLFLDRRELAGGGAPLCMKLQSPDDPAAELVARRLAPE